MSAAVEGRGLRKGYGEITGGLILGPQLGPILGNALWLVVLTAAVFAVPVRATRRRLVA